MQKQFSLRDIKKLINLFSIELAKEKSPTMQNHYKDVLFGLRMIKVHNYNSSAYSVREQIQKGWL